MMTIWHTDSCTPEFRVVPQSPQSVEAMENRRTGRSRKAASETLGGLTDEQLYARYRKSGDRAVFRVLVERYERELYNYLRRYLGDAELADDAFQGTFLQVHLKCDTFQEGRRFRPWLYAVATNQAIDAQRRAKRHRMVSLDRGAADSFDENQRLGDIFEGNEPDPFDEAVRSERGAWVRSAVAQLSPSLRPVIELVYYQGLSYGDAAEALGIPVGTVKSRMHAAVKKLGELWEQARQEHAAEAFHSPQ